MSIYKRIGDLMMTSQTEILFRFVFVDKGKQLFCPNKSQHMTRQLAFRHYSRICFAIFSTLFVKMRLNTFLNILQVAFNEVSS